jgi:hypothetical protein
MICDKYRGKNTGPQSVNIGLILGEGKYAKFILSKVALTPYRWPGKDK